MVPMAWALVGATTERPDEGREVGDFYNVVAPSGADPWVIRHTDGRYYATVTTGRDVVLWRSETLSGLGGGERKVVWTPPREGPQSRDLWAPELHRLGDAWFLYFAADDGENARHRMYVLENPSPDPFEGRFTLKGKVSDPAADRWAIDGTVLPLGGRLYFLWSGWEGDEDVRQDLYIAPMSNPWTLSGPRVRISRPTLPWETRGGPPAVNEGPQVLVRGDKVHVVFSASGSWTDHYALGLLTARADADPLSPSSWSKHPEPVFASGRGVFAPGHASFVASPDGREDWIVYHAAKHRGSGWSRLIRAQRFLWTADGVPEFGSPADPDRPIPLPSGEPRRRRFEAELAAIEGDARPSPDPTASGGSKVVGLGSPRDAITLNISVDAAGTYLIAARASRRSSGKAAASHRLTVNAGAAREVRYEDSGGGWSNAFLALPLEAGANRLRFAPGDHTAELDCLDLVLAPLPRAASVEEAAPRR
jgi:GH43 family beta-xylosidase